ncbi:MULTISPECIES: L-threonylcarbamoyladenylate synthase [Pseudoalteromonas]|uniref:Threonylcarbamoyl-AMP synthase n=1 Tax=Pseudoalteromonas amylolytica TaxID=1859457 RepID=A0A1S1MZA3_9GAMM|nr:MULTISPECIES: L-threonylcarbamoyladenylate synthase [Pseudoalteromonas]OHU90209.1 threonylcarbamoyl-AMP synthase [Pseudoalteromonas sp. JW3]OHU92424.1 threonylcarbamoyl-AMP synthase [Pseudoalteromonas amylolytica]
MITEVLAIDDEHSLDKALEALRLGELVAIPTETVYGLAADANQPQAVSKIFAAKGRPADHPLIVHVDSVEKVGRWAAYVPECVAKLADAFWPGPLTLILPKAEHVSTVVTGGHNTVGIRVPNQAGVLKLLNRLDSGLAAPSANPYKRISPTTAEQVMYGMDGKIAAVLDGGPCEVGLESTILDISTQEPRILRAGPVTKSQIEAVLGCEVSVPQSHNVAVPGNVKAHYQPSKPVQLLCGEVLASTLAEVSPSAQNDIAVLYYSQQLQTALEGNEAVTMKLSANKAHYAQNLYYALHQLDQADVTQIWVELPPNDETWLDVHDRLSRSAAK